MRVPAALAVLALVVAGCTSAPPPPGGAGAPGPVVVKAVGSACGQCFEPLSAGVAAGGKVRWVGDTGSHTVTFEGPVDGGAGAPPDSGNLDPGQSFELSFPKPGAYRYRCLYHSSGFEAGKGMVGEVRVT